VADEIGAGQGANFVLRRSYNAMIADYGPRAALSFFRRLLTQERGAYWTFLISTRARTFVGATPERHVSLTAGKAVMNPISGTYRYPPSGPELDGVLTFLADQKEAEELFMVLDEELKMMARICHGRICAIGPRLKEMSHLAHTEYYIEGRSSRDPRDILRETLFAPTVTGSPLESACRVIRRYEPKGRSYYSGVAALIGHDPAGARTMDSAILIRTVEIEPTGRVSIGSGATLVRHSDPLSEARETQGKIEAPLRALEYREPVPLAEHSAVLDALSARNARLAGYWLSESAQLPVVTTPASASGRKTLIVDAEDTFTAMIGHLLRTLGSEPEIRRYDEDFDVADYDLVVTRAPSFS
jgi:phenazine biosynthesis protein phzE